MDLSTCSAVVTGGASGLAHATARRLVARGTRVVILDLPSSAGAAVAAELGARFVAGDVTDPDPVLAAIDTAQSLAPLRAVVHCAGRGGTVRVVNKDGSPGDLDLYQEVVRVNLIGSFNVLRLTAAAMAGAEPVDGERGAVVLTSSVAAYEGQVGQLPYASAKAGIVGMTLVAARDLAQRLIRVVTIAPGIFDTPILDRLPAELKDRLGAQVPHPARLGRAEEFALLAEHVFDNPYLNGETIRLDGAVRMQPR
jgi:NAD(P)-dependent dehydrogenase (short-subunit alcohol dehydrogenase family)